MGRFRSLNESLITSTDKQILEVPGEKCLWSRREEGGCGGVQAPPLPSALLGLDEALLLLAHWLHLRVGWVA